MMVNWSIDQDKRLPILKKWSAMMPKPRAAEGRAVAPKRGAQGMRHGFQCAASAARAASAISSWPALVG